MWAIEDIPQGLDQARAAATDWVRRAEDLFVQDLLREQDPAVWEQVGIIWLDADPTIIQGIPYPEGRAVLLQIASSVVLRDMSEVVHLNGERTFNGAVFQQYLERLWLVLASPPTQVSYYSYRMARLLLGTFQSIKMGDLHSPIRQRLSSTYGLKDEFLGTPASRSGFWTRIDQPPDVVGTPREAPPGWPDAFAHVGASRILRGLISAYTATDKQVRLPRALFQKAFRSILYFTHQAELRGAGYVGQRRWFRQILQASPAEWANALNAIPADPGVAAVGRGDTRSPIDYLQVFDVTRLNGEMPIRPAAAVAEIRVEPHTAGRIVVPADTLGNGSPPNLEPSFRAHRLLGRLRDLFASMNRALQLPWSRLLVGPRVSVPDRHFWAAALQYQALFGTPSGSVVVDAETRFPRTYFKACVPVEEARARTGFDELLGDHNHVFDFPTDIVLQMLTEWAWPVLLEFIREKVSSSPLIRWQVVRRVLEMDFLGSGTAAWRRKAVLRALLPMESAAAQDHVAWGTQPNWDAGTRFAVLSMLRLATIPQPPPRPGQQAWETPDEPHQWVRLTPRARVTTLGFAPPEQSQFSIPGLALTDLNVPAADEVLFLLRWQELAFGSDGEILQWVRNLSNTALQDLRAVAQVREITTSYLD